MDNWPFEYFEKEELITPASNPYSAFEDMPAQVQVRLMDTLAIIDGIRRFYSYPLKITSTYRPNSIGSAHEFGYAIDFQPVKLDREWGFKVIRYLQAQTDFNNFRLFWEWQIKETFGWIHIDRNFKDDGQKIFMIGHPNQAGGMSYKTFTGLAPWQYLGIEL